jgi:hypothetical protein
MNNPGYWLSRGSLGLEMRARDDIAALRTRTGDRFGLLQHVPGRWVAGKNVGNRKLDLGSLPSFPPKSKTLHTFLELPLVIGPEAFQ